MPGQDRGHGLHLRGPRDVPARRLERPRLCLRHRHAHGRVRPERRPRLKGFEDVPAFTTSQERQQIPVAQETRRHLPPRPPAPRQRCGADDHPAFDLEHRGHAVLQGRAAPAVPHHKGADARARDVVPALPQGRLWRRPVPGRRRQLHPRHLLPHQRRIRRVQRSDGPVDCFRGRRLDGVRHVGGVPQRVGRLRLGAGVGDALRVGLPQRRLPGAKVPSGDPRDGHVPAPLSQTLQREEDGRAPGNVPQGLAFAAAVHLARGRGGHAAVHSGRPRGSARLLRGRAAAARPRRRRVRLRAPAAAGSGRRRRRLPASRH
mmetsp:Transcript_1593/g.5826  ORF Transcript_1593/g.5826 Transcript_1593/m.5826 type:complete len:317 (-) Transcript_1593:1623-2573(-)